MEISSNSYAQVHRFFLYENEDIEGILVDEDGEMLDFDADGFPVDDASNEEITTDPAHMIDPSNDQ